MRRNLLLIAAVFVVASCGDGSGPGGGRPGLTLISGDNVTDTINAQPLKALVVEVRDASGAIAPQRTVVRFSSPVISCCSAEMLVGALTSTQYGPFTSGETDGAGRTAVLVQLGGIAGPARIVVSVPTLGVQDTARYTVLPGQPAAILMTPSDTSMYASGSYTVHGSVVDRFMNARNDPVVYTASSPGVSVSSSGVVTASTTGRYTLTGTAGGASGVSSLSIVPPGIVTALVLRANGERIVTFNLDGSGLRDVIGVMDNDNGIGPRPRWLPGSSTIIYSDIVAGREQIRTIDASGNVSTLIPSPPATLMQQNEPSPSANAPVLYFTGHDSRCSPPFCLFRSGIDGTNPELLTELIAAGEAATHPSASPDGSKVAFTTSGPKIKVFDYNTKTISAWSVTGDYPAWSPDGAQIASTDPNGLGNLRLVNADGTNQRLISSGGRQYTNAPVVWSPDSKWLLGVNISGFLDIIEVATGKVLPIRNGPGYLTMSWR
jgi:Tol biopolymer transport system component